MFHAGLRALDYTVHTICYFPNVDDKVAIIRVLHQSMDAKRHL